MRFTRATRRVFKFLGRKPWDSGLILGAKSQQEQVSTLEAVKDPKTVAYTNNNLEDNETEVSAKAEREEAGDLEQPKSIPVPYNLDAEKQEQEEYSDSGGAEGTASPSSIHV